MNTLCFPRLPMLSALVFLLVFTLLTPLHLGAEAEYPEDIAVRLQARYDSMQSLEFSFEQRSQGQMTGRPRLGQGNALFYKNEGRSLMRWNYESPDYQVLVSDGVTFKMYFAELSQMIVTPAENLDQDLTYTFFSGKATIEQLFHILPPDQHYIDLHPATSPVRVIKLVPKEQTSQAQSIHLWVDQESLINRIEIRDHFDTVTVLSLSQIKVDAQHDRPVAEVLEQFSFSPPQGTEIIKQ